MNRFISRLLRKLSQKQESVLPKNKNIKFKEYDKVLFRGIEAEIIISFDTWSRIDLGDGDVAHVSNKHIEKRKSDESV